MINENCLVGCKPKTHHFNCNNYFTPIKLVEYDKEEIIQEVYNKIDLTDVDTTVLRLEHIVTKFDLKTRKKHKELFQRHFIIDYGINKIGLSMNRLTKLLDIDISKVRQSLIAHESMNSCDWYKQKNKELLIGLKEL